MKTYRVYARYTSRCYIDVEANSEEEAYEKAEEEDFGNFTPREEYGESPIEYYDCEEV